MRTFTIKSLAGALALACLSIGPASALNLGGVLGGILEPPPSTHLKDQGVGLHTGLSVVNQVAGFTLNRNMVSCGVGTLNALGAVGPFEMLMYALQVDSYQLDRINRVITATGIMRSTTRVAGIVVEDTNGEGLLNPPPHDFVAFGFDGGDTPGDDRFELHFKTPFWNTGNPLCTASSVVTGGCMFGHELFMGEIDVQPQ